MVGKDEGKMPQMCFSLNIINAEELCICVCVCWGESAHAVVTSTKDVEGTEAW